MATLRRAGARDLDAIATLHVDVWRDTYAGIAPKAAFDLLTVERRRAGWTKALAPESGQTVLLAEANGRLQGFVSAGAPSQAEIGDGADRGEIKHLYVAIHAQGQGIGRQLLNAGFDALRADGCERAALSVVVENTPAQRFYAAQGGAATGRFTDAGPVWRSDNLIYSWPL